VPAVLPAVLGVVRALVLRRAAFGVALAHLDAVLLDALAGRVVQVAVVRVVDVPLVPDRGVAAARAMTVRVPLVAPRLVMRHAPSSGNACRRPSILDLSDLAPQDRKSTRLNSSHV